MRWFSGEPGNPRSSSGIHPPGSIGEPPCPLTIKLLTLLPSCTPHCGANWAGIPSDDGGTTRLPAIVWSGVVNSTLPERPGLAGRNGRAAPKQERGMDGNVPAVLAAVGADPAVIQADDVGIDGDIAAVAARLRGDLGEKTIEPAGIHGDIPAVRVGGGDEELAALKGQGGCGHRDASGTPARTHGNGMPHQSRLHWCGWAAQDDRCAATMTSPPTPCPLVPQELMPASLRMRKVFRRRRTHRRHCRSVRSHCSASDPGDDCRERWRSSVMSPLMLTLTLLPLPGQTCWS